MMNGLRILAGALLMLLASASQAFDFKTVGPHPVILFDQPTQKGSKLFVAPRGMPVEVVLTQGDWAKVRDVHGDLAWTMAAGLSARRNLIVRTANAKLRATADESAAAVISLDKGVLLELVDPQATNWVKVRHRDGVAGFIKATDVWGI
jgi:SH3-like domain-containing protein